MHLANTMLYIMIYVVCFGEHKKHMPAHIPNKTCYFQESVTI